jgi:hypothetical protein
VPAKSKAQLRMMQAAEHSPEFAKKVGISKKVATKFVDDTPKGLLLPARVKRKK